MLQLLQPTIECGAKIGPKCGTIRLSVATVLLASRRMLVFAGLTGQYLVSGRGGLCSLNVLAMIEPQMPSDTEIIKTLRQVLECRDPAERLDLLRRLAASPAPLRIIDCREQQSRIGLQVPGLPETLPE